MKFEYEAKNEDEETVTGTLEADSEGEARLKLRQQDLYILSLEEEKKPFYKKEVDIDFSRFQRITDNDLVVFSRQLAIMLESQVGIIESLRILADQVKKEKFKKVIEDVASQVEEGTPFSTALKSHGDVFSSFYIGAVESGEASGNLPESLHYVKDHIARNAEFKKKLISAMIYPAFIVLVFGFVVTFLMVYVIPDIVEMIEELDAEMPFITQVVIAISDFVVNWGIYTLGGLIAALFSFYKFIMRGPGKEIFDKVILRVPVLGGFLRKLYVTYFVESMKTLLSSGLDFVKALEITTNILGNTTYKRLTKETTKDIKEGKELSESLAKHPKYFPKLMTQMITVGEKTGEMEKVLTGVIDFYRDEVESAMDTFVKMAEPILIILLGAGVGALVVSVLLPIYEVGMGM